MVDLYFYTTVGCHLCEEAERLFLPLTEHSLFNLIRIDIAECNDQSLSQRYEIRIPVLQRSDNQLELGWPFDQTDIKKFLS